MSSQPTATAHLQLAYLLLEHGQFEDAHAAAKDAIAAAPDHPLPHVISASIFTAQGDFKQAIAALHRVTKRWPTSPGAHLYMAEACWFAERPRKVAQHLELAKSHDLEHVWSSQIDALTQLFAQALGPASLSPTTQVVDSPT